MIGSDNFRRTDAGRYTTAGPGHAASMKCIRCEALITNSAARHDWRGVKAARFCSGCEAWLAGRRVAA